MLTFIHKYLSNVSKHILFIITILNIFISIMAEVEIPLKIMHECHSELLMNIPDEDLEKLAEMYRSHGEIPYASSIITNGIRVRKRRSFFIRFMSPGNCWREDGTFLVLMEFPHTYDLAVFTLDSSCNNLYEGLMRTKRLHFERPIVFYAVHKSVYPTVMRVLEEKELEYTDNSAHDIFTISREKALEFKIECPDEVELRKLTNSDAAAADDHWPHKFPHSGEFLSCLIELIGGWGIFLKSNKQLVSWGVLTGLGQLGIIQTLEGYQKKGYACIITKALAKKVAERGENPAGIVESDNAHLQSVYKKLGFEHRGQCNYIKIKKA